MFVGYTRRGIVRYLQKHLQDPTVRQRWKRLIVHHTFKPTLADFEQRPDGAYWVTVIDRVHRAKGWGGIGYHFLITPDGVVYPGRPLTQQGAHTVGQNRIALGICVLGNFDDETMPPEQYASLKYLLAFLCHFLSLPPSSIFFHRDFAPKTCPGSKLDREQLRLAVQRTLPELPSLLQTLLNSPSSS